ncbi:MAG: phosphatase PAP2 family protein [Ignavibacteriaceae bacterium]
MMNVQKIIYLLIIVWSVLAGYFAFSDLQISNSIVNPNAGWAVFLERYGELPGLLIIILGIFLYSQKLNYNSKIEILIVRMVLVLGETVTLTYFMFVVLQNVAGSQSFFISFYKFIASLSLVVSILLVFTVKIWKLQVSDLTHGFSKIVVGMAFIGYLICIQLVKIFWGRVRFRDLDALYSNFTSWYIPNGITGDQSFPSGHAAMAWMLLPLIVFLPKKNNIIKFISAGLIAAWGIAVPLSRVVTGAHYASDVLFGSFIMIISFLVLAKKHLSGKS